MPEIRLLLVDDHEIVRSGLKMLLESQPDISIIGEAGSGMQAIEIVNRLSPDVVVMDITLPDISGIETTKRIKRAHPEVAIIALTIHEDEQYFFEMLKAGAAGYVPKRAASEDLIQAVRSAFAGDIYLYPTLARALVSDFLSMASMGDEKATMNGLTSREQEILGMLAEGCTNDEIANKLVISKHTVERHRENVMRKLNLHSRSELVKYAIRKGLIEP